MSNCNAKDALHEAIKQLASASSLITSARIDAEILLCHVLQKSRTWLYAYFDQLLTEIQIQQYQKLINQRQNGTPIAYLIGQREFWSLPLQVTKDTLIPRPETELLVEKTLQLLQSNKKAKILELGTGSGAISLALASEQPDWQIFACDINPNTINVAQNNAKNLNYKNIHFFCSDWFSSISQQLSFDAIISNPPYLACDDPHKDQGDLRFEPLNALVSGPLGLDALAHIICKSKNYLKPNGYLLLEHGSTQKEAVFKELHKNQYGQIQCWQDIQDHPRVSSGCVMCNN